MQIRISILFLSALLALLPACTWVKLSPTGEQVRVAGSSEVAKCKKIGATNVSLLAKIAGFPRDEKKVKQELETLARNNAADINGDTIVATSKVKDGKQTFAVLQCFME